MTQPLISLCMIVKNEADTLACCLNSVRKVIDEIVIVDTGSTDATLSIARRYGARIISYPWNGDFASARNAGLAAARGTWILVLDADEELDPESKSELRICAEHTEFEAFFVRIHNHKGTDRASQTLTVNPILRMFKRRLNYRFSGIIHEQIAAEILRVTPAAAMHMSTVIVHHYGYADGVVEKKDKIRRNIGLIQEQLRLNPKDAFHHFNMAVEYMRLGDYRHALEHIRTSLAQAEPDTSYIHLLFKYEIRCLAALKELDEALEACGRGIALFPDYPDLHHLQGVLLLQAAAWAEAKAALNKALAIGASPPAYHTESGLGTYLTLVLQGQVCQQTGEEHEAIACFTRAAQLHPEPWPVLARLLRLFKCAGRESGISSWLAEHLPAILTGERQRLIRQLVQEGCYATAADMLESGEVVMEQDARGRTAEEQAAGEPAVVKQAARERDTEEQATRERTAVEQATLEQATREQDTGEWTAMEQDTRERTAMEQDAEEQAALEQDTRVPGTVDLAAQEQDTGEPATVDLAAQEQYTEEPAAFAQDAHSLVLRLRQVEVTPVAELEYDDIAALIRHPLMMRIDAASEASGSARLAAQAWILMADKALAALETSAVYAPAAAKIRLALPLPGTNG